MDLGSLVAHCVAIGLVPATIWSLVGYLYFQIGVQIGIRTINLAGAIFVGVWIISALIGILFGREIINTIIIIGLTVFAIIGVVRMACRPDTKVVEHKVIDP